MAGPNTNRYYPLSLTNDQRQSIQDSGGYYDDNGNWVDMSGTQSGGAPSGGGQSGGGQSGGGVNPWLGILTALGATAGGAYLRNRSQQNAVPPELRQLLSQSVDRQAFQNPLFEANTRGTFAMLPGFATNGLSLKGSLSSAPPKVDTSQPSGSDDPGNPLTSWNPLRNPLLAGALGALLNGGIPGTGGQGNIGNAIRDLINAFRGHNTNPFGGNTTVTGVNNHNLPSYDPFGYGFDGLPGFSGMPSNPAGGSPGGNVGPGMQDFYDWLRRNGGDFANPGGGDGNPYQYLPGYGLNPDGTMPGGDNNPGGGDWPDHGDDE